ncbi:MAG: PilT protein-like protein [Candidatus Magnetoglobus multicellularis str. Araruama]|uniref:PilT protein-like protein n=1 Tax=Candidatus Magnetoglobus multicellularis str. Araruama TaxID=890399 RepID=A0A1V1P2G5_9BACT|nr:MAG: PilT protein-like protein [Candidatus Magnetoglobus multicellularis str. Araruama]
MRALLDTNSFLWFISGNEKLSIKARNFIEDFENELVLSIASLWEIAIKVSIGKLQLLKHFDILIPEKIEENEIEILNLELKHFSTMMKLPFHHRDPFDRIIIAQSITENISLITSDGIFEDYLVKVIW